jgi:hypothetical protein
MQTVTIAAGQQFSAVDSDDIRAIHERIDRKFAEQTREFLRGIKLMRLPVSYVTAVGASTVIPGTSGGYGLIGPESGFIWRVQRITIASSAADVGAASLYVTSDETQQQKNLIDNNLKIGTAYYPPSNGLFLMPGEGLQVVATTVATNVYTMTGQVFSVPAEMVGKLV